MKTTNKQRNLNRKTCHKLWLLAASCFWLLAASAWAQHNIFVNVEGIPGESISASHPNTIEATGFSFGATNTLTSSCGNFLDLSITKFVDKATPLLMLKCASATNSSPIGQVWLVVQRNIGGSSRDFLEIRTGVARVSSITSGSTTNGYPTEVVTFRFTDMGMTYKVFDAAGNLQGLVQSCFDTDGCWDCSK